jgi:hypothetical protein
LVVRRVGRFFGLFLFGFGRRISRPFFLSQLFPGFSRRLGDPRLQFLGINLLGARTEKAPPVHGDGVFKRVLRKFL